MKRIVMLLLSGLFIILAAYSIWQVLGHDSARLKVSGQPHYVNGRDISGVEVQTLEGHPQLLKSELTGDINIINFWASWCEPCNKEMPELVHYNDIKPNHIKLIGLNVQDDQKNRQAFLKKYDVDYPVVVGSEQLLKQYKIYNIPTTIFVDKEGRVLTTYMGELNQEKLEKLIEQVEEKL
ncbi:TlpA family protein disulfide reductase [Macrococcus hajekii]|uniref:TlpA family protein disulfide reductase n=1 Tax=Macrococcus hajekii TaxID=198482 RepID=A0A4R6BIQ0_9STAP|nr:TlpA disulfide reductase family protein [Macrococcus hajekii]TDM01467.1 TlpA family protein disulfide reductase [Macrococcus hajekii]GGB00220.1 hypothetical protein GCM10007190_05350 [Macrococcus hajekii]